MNDACQPHIVGKSSRRARYSPWFASLPPTWASRLPLRWARCMCSRTIARCDVFNNNVNVKAVVYIHYQHWISWFGVYVPVDISTKKVDPNTLDAKTVITLWQQFSSAWACWLSMRPSRRAHVAKVNYGPIYAQFLVVQVCLFAL